MVFSNTGIDIECEHGCTAYAVVKPEELALLMEGICCGCVVPGVRGEEWVTCPCCGVGWKIETKFLTAKIPICLDIGEAISLSVAPIDE